MSKVFCIDVAKCNGCYNCQLACKDEHVGNDWTPYAKPQPEIGQFWCKVQENVGGTIPRSKSTISPSCATTATTHPVWTRAAWTPSTAATTAL